MTARKHLKARIRARMAQTGERYVTARRHVVPNWPVVTSPWSSPARSWFPGLTGAP